MTKNEYFEKAKYIWENYVPKTGQADFVQGELLRAIEKLRDEAQRNGNINFNKDCHGILIHYLRNKLIDEQVFASEKLEEIKKDLERLSNNNTPYLDDDIYDRINDRIVDWFTHNGDSVRHEFNPQLYC